MGVLVRRWFRCFFPEEAGSDFGFREKGVRILVHFERVSVVAVKHLQGGMQPSVEVGRSRRPSTPAGVRHAQESAPLPRYIVGLELGTDLL